MNLAVNEGVVRVGPTQLRLGDVGGHVSAPDLVAPVEAVVLAVAILARVDGLVLPAEGAGPVPRGCRALVRAQFDRVSGPRMGANLLRTVVPLGIFFLANFDANYRNL